MTDKGKTKQQLINELAGLLQRIARLEMSENEPKHVVEKLQDSERKYRQLLEEMSDGYAVIQERKIVFANRRFDEIFGYEPGQLLGKSIFEFLVSNDREPAIEHYEKVVRGHQVSDERREAVVMKRDGTEIVIESSIKPVDYEGSLALCVIIRDITERKRAEGKYRQLLEEMNDGYGVVQDGKYVFVNRRFSEIFGYKPDQIMGKSIADFMMAEDRQATMDLYKRVMRGEEVFPERYEGEAVRRGDGSKIVVESSTKPIEYEGKPAFSIILRDITKSKRAEEELIAAQKYASNLIERSLDMIISVDRECRIVEFNSAAQETFDYSKEEVLGKHVSILYADPEEGLKALESVRRTDSFVGEIINKRKNGETFISFLAASSLLNEKGEFLGTMGVSRDITLRKLMEARIKYRLKVEEALVGVSRLFATRQDVDLDEVLKTVGEIVSANRAYIFLFRQDGKKMDNIREWCSPGTEPQINNLQDLDSTQFTWWIARLNAGENIVIHDVNTLPAEAVSVKEILQSQDIRSLLVVPIYVKSSILGGFMGFDDTEKCRQWSGEDASLLRVVAEMLTNYWERKRAEAILRDSEEKLRLIFESVPEGIVVCDLSGTIIDLNNGAINMLDYEDKEELIGRKGLEFIAQGDHVRAGEDIRTTLETGSIGVSQYTFKRKDGSEFPAAWSAAVLRDHGGQPAGFIFIAMDTTEQQKMQEQLMLTDRLASIGQLTSGIAHELNNPLTRACSH